MFLELCNSGYWIFFLLFRCFSHFTARDSYLSPNYEGGLLIVFNHLFLPWVSHYPSAECQFDLAIVNQLHCLCDIVLTIFSIAWIITPARTFPHQDILLGWLWSYLSNLWPPSCPGFVWAPCTTEDSGGGEQIYSRTHLTASFLRFLMALLKLF